jgi:type II secretory pathway component GspD/PulD (secretin)
MLLVGLSVVCRAQEVARPADKGEATGSQAPKAGTLQRRDAPKDELVIRRHLVTGNMMELITSLAREKDAGSGSASNQSNDTTPGTDLKTLFGMLGVPWTAGSYVSCLSAISKLEVCNTRENQVLLERVLDEMCVTPRQVQIDMQFVAFDLTNINRLVMSGPGIHTASLVSLWSSGRGELLAAPTVVTKCGQEAVAKGVTEFIYPTSFTCSGIEPTNSSGSTTGGVVEPGGFQTREVGAILQVVPEVNAGGQIINLTLNPQQVEEPVWESYGSAGRQAAGKERAAQPRQPFFHIYATSTSVSLASGRRVLVGGGMPSRDGKRLVYLFVTATVLDMYGEGIKFRDDREDAAQPAR